MLRDVWAECLPHTLGPFARHIETGNEFLPTEDFRLKISERLAPESWLYFKA